MKHDYIDRYARLQSPVHRLSPGIKLAVAVVLVIVTVAAPFPLTPFYVSLAVALCLILALSRIPLGFFFWRLLTLQPFVAGVMLLALVRPEGWTVAARIAVKSNLCLSTMILLSNTTAFASILTVLIALRFPRLLITVLSLMYRYIFVLVDQAERMSRARRSRTFRRRRGSWKLGAGVIGQLFIRSTERAERVYAAMTARGWRL